MLFESGATCSIAVMCNTVREVVDRLERIVEVVLVAEEALYGKNVLVLEDWVGRQPQWSDQPFVVPTKVPSLRRSGANWSRACERRLS